MDTLPPYFKEYMEEKFKSIDEQLNQVTCKLDDLKTDTKWLNQKVWMALGAIVVLSAGAGIFIAFFKQVNQENIHTAVKQALSDDTRLQDLLSNYDQIIINH